MVMLEWFLYLVGVVIGYASFRFNWWLFPKKLSRWKRYRMSEYDFVIERTITAVAGAIVFGGGSIYAVYQIFHEDLLKPKDVKAVIIQTAPPIHQEETSTPQIPSQTTDSHLPQSAKLQSTINVTNIVNLWDKAHNQRDYALFDSLYMPYVRYYGQEWEKQKCINKKKQLFQLHPDFSQQSKNIYSENMEEGIVKVTFDKRVYCDGQVQTFPSYLWLTLSDGVWKIEIESDEITDTNSR